MADILIRGMEMPNSCVECSLTGLPVAVSILGASCPWCREVIDAKVNLRIARHEDCPLHELPEHGDLVDIRKVLEIAMQYVADDDGSCSKANEDLRYMLDDIEAAPVIIQTTSKMKGE